MDYKQKYNKLVEAVKVLQKTNPSDEGIQNWVNDNVPELAESEDEKARKYLLHCVEQWEEGHCCWNSDKEAIKPLKAYLEKQKPVEWSEEDETALQDALWCIEQARKQAKDENDMGTCWFAERWLKSLKPQPKQEWSEEDSCS